MGKRLDSLCTDFSHVRGTYSPQPETPLRGIADTLLNHLVIIFTAC
jgi:hypothetical protein